MGDKIKLAVALLLVIAAIAGFYYYSEHSTVLRLGGVLLMMAASTAIAYQTATGRAAWSFMRESQAEMRKVVWPTPKETLYTTGSVMAMVVVVSLFLWGLDAFLRWLIRAIMS